MTTRLHTAVAFATAGILATGLGLISSPAHAGDVGPGRATAPQHPTTLGQKRLSPAQLVAVRDRQRTMLAQPAPARTLARAAAGTPIQKFTVDTTEDSDLADPAGTTCIDAATGGCSLRAAVDAANNRQTPVQITLGKHAYTLASATELAVTNPAGTSIVGAGAAHTSIHGTPSSGIFLEEQSADGGPAPLLYVTGLTVTGGTADNGGAFELEDSVDNGATGPTVVLDGVSATGNTANFVGGALYAGGDATVYATRSSFTGNASATAGGLYTYRSNVNLTDVTVTDNHASEGGGGWYTQYSVDRMRGGSLSGNSAFTGGGLYDLWGDVTLSDVHVDHNTAIDDDNSTSNSAGGIFAYSDLLEVDAGTISHNRASGDQAMGGGIEAQGSEVALHGVTMAGDRVPPGVTDGFGGGAIFLEGATSPVQLTIDHGSKITGANGSAVYANATNGAVDLEINGSRLARNSDTSSNGPNGSGCGGALCSFSGLDEATNLTMNHDTFLANTSTGKSGSGAISVWGDESAGVRVHVVRSLFEANVAGAGGHGGALGIVNRQDSTPLSVRTEADTFTGNQAGTSASPGRGGAIGIEGSTAYDDEGSTFSKNRARGDDAYGGAVDSAGLQSTRFVGTTFSRNAAGAPTTGTGHGGAVFTDGQSGNAFLRVTMSGNRSAGDGGGLATGDDAFDVSVERSTISGNTAGISTASGLGGGVYSAQAALTLENSTVTDNRAAQGGGIYSAESTLGLRYSTVTGNVAGQGGGLYLSANGGTVLGSILSANHKSAKAEQDCWSSGASSILHSLGGNLLGQKGCVTAVSATDKVTKRPRLAPLAKNGGPTRTMALAKKSPAIGRGTLQCPATDQRGRQRPAHHCDAGAFELPKVKKHHHPHHQH